MQSNMQMKIDEYYLDSTISQTKQQNSHNKESK
jgi:hypothetical protein